jgi:hypothetical protein
MTLALIPSPSVVVNGYLWNTIEKIDSALVASYGGITPIFPLSDSASGVESWGEKAYIVYDRMLQLSRNPLYPVKQEQTLYSLKGNEEQTIQWALAIQVILDRMDDAAKDINEWNRSLASPHHIYFHHVRVFQLLRRPTESREFSNRPHYISQFMIETEYHFTDSLEDLISS